MFQVKKEDEGPILWFNEIRVTKALANKEYSNKNFEKAALFCEKILDNNNNDLDYRIMLSKCQKQIFQPDLAKNNHLIAEKKYPNSLKVLENAGYKFFEDFNFEESLKIFLEGHKRIDQPRDFKIGVAKVDHVYDDIFDLNNSKYKKNNLGYIVEHFENQGNLDTLISTDDFYSRNNLKRKKYNSFYLRGLNGYQKHIAKILKFNTPMLPFKETEENIYSDMELLVNAADMVEAQLYGRRAFYLYQCDVYPMRGERLVAQKINLKIIKDMSHLQMVKYLETIIQLILKNEIKEAKNQTELMIKYMKKVHRDSRIVLNEIYRTFGARQYLLFQNINRWNDKYNRQRMLVLLGVVKDSFLMQESLYGSYNINFKDTLDQLSERIKITKSIVEKVYIHFEMAKYYIQLKMLKKAKLNALSGLKLAEEAQCQAWIGNLLIIIASIDFQMNNKTKCCNELKRAIEIACAIDIPEVKMFLKTLVKIIPEVDPLKITTFDKKKMDIINLMPNDFKKKQAILMFKRLDTETILENITISKTNK